MDKKIFEVWLKDNDQPNTFDLKDIQSFFSFEYFDDYTFSDIQTKSHILKQITQRPPSSKEQEVGHIYKEQIRSDFLPDCSIRWVSDKTQYGLFTRQSLNVGEFAGRYCGIIRENNDHFTTNDYLYEYPVIDTIGRSYVIDAKNGNLTRFINHSYTPNLKPIYAYYEGMYHLIFIVIRPIHRNEQLCYDYGQPYWNLRGQPEKN